MKNCQFCQKTFLSKHNFPIIKVLISPKMYFNSPIKKDINLTSEE